MPDSNPHSQHDSVVGVVMEDLSCPQAGGPHGRIPPDKQTWAYMWYNITAWPYYIKMWILQDLPSFLLSLVAALELAAIFTFVGLVYSQSELLCRSKSLRQFCELLPGVTFGVAVGSVPGWVVAFIGMTIDGQSHNIRRHFQTSARRWSLQAFLLFTIILATVAIVQQFNNSLSWLDCSSSPHHFSSARVDPRSAHPPSSSDIEAGTKHNPAQINDAVQVANSLKNDVEEVIRKYSDSEDKPPFTEGEIVVMAVICVGKEYATVCEILLWIFETLYYRRGIFEDFVTGKDYEDWLGDEDRATIRHRLLRGLNCWDAALHNAESSELVAYRNEGGANARIKVAIPQARLFLRKWLEPERQGTFPFTRLPEGYGT